MKTVVGLFDQYEDADRAVSTLVNAGFNRDHLSIAVRENTMLDVDDEHLYDDTMDEASGAAVGAGTGAVGGAVLGGLTGLLIGVGALAIPGIGPVVAAGSLANTLGSTALGAGIGAGVGAVTGGLVGGLVDLGVPEEEAHFYAEGVKRGGILVVAQTEDTRAPIAASIMRQANALDVDTRREAWRAAGWQRFDHSVTPDESYPLL
jgi:hypothetical protein